MGLRHWLLPSLSHSQHRHMYYSSNVNKKSAEAWVQCRMLSSWTQVNSLVRWISFRISTCLSPLSVVLLLSSAPLPGHRIWYPWRPSFRPAVHIAIIKKKQGYTLEITIKQRMTEWYHTHTHTHTYTPWLKQLQGHFQRQPGDLV